jgi:hypothetical protein
MNNIIMTMILALGWPALIIGSIYLFIKGKHVYNLVKGSLVGKVVRILIYTMMVEMYSLGIVCTGFMYCSVKGLYIVIPVFLVWFVMFFVTIKVLMNAEKEARALTGGTKA